MENKYLMDKEDNIFFAKRKLVDNLYKSANLEGIAVTFADTVSFMNNVILMFWKFKFVLQTKK